jgi:glucose-1-phosphate cytidylyltransferase
MKAVILAGGLGTRLSEETVARPKPMIEIGGKPILWHVMNIYSSFGVNEFFIAAGYKAEVIKEYFLNFYAINNDITIDLSNGKTVVHDGNQSNWKSWKIHVIDTGLHTQTGGRLKRLGKWIGNEDAFLFTYGDGVADIDVNALLAFHKSHGKLATVTTVRAPARFGRIGFDGDRIAEFYEKPEAAEGWINGGYFVLNPRVLDYIEDDDSIWERVPIEKLARDGQLMGYRHYGFWSCMDTLKEKNYLEDLWNTGRASWKIW